MDYFSKSIQFPGRLKNFYFSLSLIYITYDLDDFLTFYYTFRTVKRKIITSTLKAVNQLVILSYH